MLDAQYPASSMLDDEFAPNHFVFGQTLSVANHSQAREHLWRMTMDNKPPDEITQNEWEENSFDEEEKTPIRNTILRIFRGIVAVIVIVGLIQFSGLYQYFFYHRTPDTVKQQVVESTLDAESISLPLTVFILSGGEIYGSQRSKDNAVGLVDNASRIWQQSDINLRISNIYILEVSDQEIELFFNEPRSFIRSIKSYNPRTINIFLVNTLRGINGIAFSDIYSVAVADYTTVYDFRTLAHEIGHILGLRHVAGDKKRLMYRGANGVILSPEEVMRARGEVYRLFLSSKP